MGSELRAWLISIDLFFCQSLMGLWHFMVQHIVIADGTHADIHEVKKWMSQWDAPVISNDWY